MDSGDVLPISVPFFTENSCVVLACFKGYNCRLTACFHTTPRARWTLNKLFIKETHRNVPRWCARFLMGQGNASRHMLTFSLHVCLCYCCLCRCVLCVFVLLDKWRVYLRLCGIQLDSATSHDTEAELQSNMEIWEQCTQKFETVKTVFDCQDKEKLWGLQISLKYKHRSHGQ